jgi:hypothetical protein
MIGQFIQSSGLRRTSGVGLGSGVALGSGVLVSVGAAVGAGVSVVCGAALGWPAEAGALWQAESSMEARINTEIPRNRRFEFISLPCKRLNLWADYTAQRKGCEIQAGRFFSAIGHWQIFLPDEV